MQKGSVRVQQGDDVRAGDLLGLVGNSGNTSEPHIHIHVQDAEDFFAPDTMGLPLQFTDFLADGQPSELGVPAQGQFITPADESVRLPR
jgi:murein DD-endopeptidase MepM/ murein hydrolase activator NlpD